MQAQRKVTKLKSGLHEGTEREPIDSLEVFEHLRDITDPEHPYTLEQLNVVEERLIEVQDAKSRVKVQFTPTVPHCSMATLIGLSIRVKLLRALPQRFKVDIQITPGAHSSEAAVNKQLADKERVAAALENPNLLDMVNRCLASSEGPAVQPSALPCLRLRASPTILHAARHQHLAVPLGMDLARDCYADIRGRSVLITGAAGGIGSHTARLLAAAGAGRLWLADLRSGPLQSLAEQLQADHPGCEVVACPPLDLGSQDSVHRWADAWQAGRAALPSTSRRPLPAASTAASSSSSSRVSGGGLSAAVSAGPGRSSGVRAGARAGGSVPALDVLINNAGANFMGVEPWSTEQGVAGLAQVNFLGPYTLTRRLAPQLLAGRGGAGGRVVNVASVMHRQPRPLAAVWPSWLTRRFSQLPPEPHLFLKDWWRGGAYRCCKLANVVFTLLLEQQRERLAAQGRPGITALAVDPGAVYSGIWATSRWLGRPPGSWVLSSLFAPPADAAATSFHAAAAKEVQGGQYFARGLFASPAIVQ
ncbi:hypothetical protein QJQ45_015911, partial [Haematococcus lacustris]